MSKSYVIQWKSRINGRAGKGTKVFQFEEAVRLAEELNSEYPGIYHEPIEANGQPEPRAPQEQEQEQTEPAEQPEAAAEIVQVTHSPDFAFSA